MEVAFDPKFVPSTLALEPVDIKRVWKAVTKYTTDPNSPSLHLERLAGRRKRLWTIRASLNLRVLLARQGSVSVFLRAGHHDDVYQTANRSAYLVPLVGGPALITVQPDAINPEVTTQPPTDDPAPGSASVDADRPPILAHWTAAELAEAGFNEEQVRILHGATADNLLECLTDTWPGPDIDNATLDLVFDLTELSPEDWRQRRLWEETQEDDERFRRAIYERGALAGLSSVFTPAEVRRLAAAPVEDWMIYLHPDQRSLVDRHFNSPARVRGSAGTGKTVVALHRAAALAKRFTHDQWPPVLFTTHVKSLSRVLCNLYRRLPTSVPGAVEFINVDKLARQVCVESGFTPNVDRHMVESAFARTYREIVRKGSPLHRAGLTRKYLRDEVGAVIKGRGIDSLPEYLEIKRTGRRVPFSAAMRRQTWELRTGWDRRLHHAGVVDFPDVIRRARDFAYNRPEPMYRSAIVDEAQDLTLVGFQLVLALLQGSSGEIPPDGLFIVGDGAQKIYPGGYTLAQAGVDIHGNSTILRVNYRNPHHVIETAMACAGSEPVNDLGERYKRQDVDRETQRTGEKPKLVKANHLQAQITFVAQRIEQLCDTSSASPGDIGVFAPTNHIVKVAKANFGSWGIHCQDLYDFNGRPNRKVKLGTFHLAKGLEFKVVFLLGLSASSFPSPRTRGQSQAEHAERTALQISGLYVAMTRARDALYILCDGEPSDVIFRALDGFEVLEV